MDTWLFRCINDGLKHPFLDAVLPFFSDKDFVVIPGAIVWGVAFALGRRQRRMHLLALLLALAMANIGSEQILKPMWAHPRPYATLEGVHLFRGEEWRDYDPAWYALDIRQSNAFPSSHAANVAAVATVLASAWPASLCVTCPAGLLVGLSRVYTGNHYPGDVLGGYAWGVGCGLAMAWLARRMARRWDRLRGPEAERAPLSTEHRVFLAVLAAWMFGNFLFIRFSGYTLAGDEAQYWDWSRRLALGYYSKPPLIAYAYRVLVGAGGNKEWAIRTGAVLLSSGTLALLYALTRRIAGDGRTALVALAIVLALPFTWVGSALMTPDALLAFAWMLALYAFHRAIRGEERWWWVVGAAFGFGLLAKYTMALLAVTLVLYLALADRRAFKTRGPYIAAALAALALSGVLYWNATHEWVSFRHTAAIGAAPERSLARSAKNLVTFLGGQAGVASPVLFILCLYATWAGSREATRLRRAGDVGWRDRAMLVCGFAVLFGFYLLVSPRNKPEPNWPVCAYLCAAPLVALAWAKAPQGHWLRRLTIVGLALGGVMGVATRASGLIYWVAEPAGEDRARVCGLEFDPGKDPTNELVGGRELGAAVARYASSNPGAGPFLFSDRYQMTAQLAFYTKGRPRAYCMNAGDRRFNQYDLWGGWEELVGRDGIFVTGGGALRAKLFADAMVSKGAFASAEFLETVEVRRREIPIKYFTIYRMRGYTGYAWQPREAHY